MNWEKRAVCRQEDPELMFPISYAATNPQVLRAKAVCRSCPVMAECGETAIHRAEPEGIWGGLTPQDRRGVRTDQAMAVTA